MGAHDEILENEAGDLLLIATALDREVTLPRDAEMLETGPRGKDWHPPTMSDHTTTAIDQDALVSPQVVRTTQTSAPGSPTRDEISSRAAAQRAQFRHDNDIQPCAPAPGRAVELRAIAGEALAVRRAAVFYTVDGSRPDPTSARAGMDAVGVSWTSDAGFLTSWRATLPAQAAGTIVRYRIGGWLRSGAQESDVEPDCWAQDGQGFWSSYAPDAGITTFAYHVEPREQYCPDWVHDAVIYQIFLDRFHPGTPDGQFLPAAGPNVLHGGTLQGVRQALPYLQELGITCIWLSPFSASPSYHRYDGTDFFTVDPALGTNADLRALSADAHARGLRVMMDFVPAHCSKLHPAFVAAQHDRSAATASWFTFRDWPSQYRSFLDKSPSLPSFNGDNAGARQYLLDSAMQWQRDYGIDAFRLDHAIGLSMDFWVALRTATRAADADVFSVGEVTDTPDSLRRYRNRLDAVMDFPLAGILRDIFTSPDGSVSALDSFLHAYFRYMADGPARVTFLDNHDMNRFLFLAHGDVARLKLAALCLFTLPGVPVIYYGTEIALPQRHDMANRLFDGDAEVRTDMVWDRRLWNLDLLAYFQQLIALRKRFASLRRGSWDSLHVDEQAAVYAYGRRLEHYEGGELVCAFNLGYASQTFPLRMPGRYTVIHTTQEIDSGSPGIAGAMVTLPAVSGAVLARLPEAV